MNPVLARWNQASAADAVREIMPCCGSRSWAQILTDRRSFTNETSLLLASDEIWRSLAPADWLEAFRSHPRIGESAQGADREQSAAWSRQEQSKVAAAADDVKTRFVSANRIYEEKFGHTFIVCATGKSPAEILAILHRRMQNDGKNELHQAAEEQRQITQLRLRKWLGI
jgi:2-oxo-4-hydroxy-4-carboxy-5-ureidoimidazoline decarboxylase